ncbi:hypothetical protein ES288_D01G051300v1 [Gossypium darwinii]|uniref:Uncharacterized protein n=1 Tax=Gossypium darwinii TaxID=34276 RepID=A0A5D2DL58_GOSDA|nr:hypothetical protein ES288_D01G051300v1 [Gossypium darwinii]
MGSEWGLSAASGLVAPLLVDYLVKPIERRIRYLFRFHKIVQELHQNQQDLAAKETQVKDDVEEAKLQIRTQVIYDQVDEWPTKAENALKDVKVLDSEIEENKRCFCLCPNWCWRYQLSQEIENKTLEIADLVKKSEFKRVGHRAKLPSLDLVTSKDNVDLKSSVRNVSGKVRGFDRVIMVTVSETVDIEKIQNKIADDLDLKFGKNTEGGKATELWSRLSNGKFLVIIDDLWKEWNDDGDLRKIGIPLVKDEKGCKIILTTRNYNVCQHMECEETIQLKVLEDGEAWTLFEMNAGIKKADSRVIGEAKKIAKECKGLPLAIVTLAKALKGKALDRWKDARKKLERILKVIDYLKDSCLLEDGDVGRYVKLHDIVRDVALWIASEEESSFMINSRLETLNKSSESSKAISLLGSEKKKFPDRLMHSKLEILLLNNCDIQGTCFLGMTELKVLNLTAVYGTGVISLYALTFLPKLRALHLDNFAHYSFLGNLTTLEILSLHGWVYEDLADELEMLENLKILDLINCACSGRFQSKVIRRLSQLEELYLPRSGISNDIFLEIKFLTKLRRLSVEVHSLHCPLDFESLKIEEVFPYNAFSQLLGNLESLEVSKIKDEYVECLTNKTQPKVSVSMILRNLKLVRIDYCKNLKVVFQMEEVEENEAPLLSNLKILRLQRLPDLSCIWELPTQHVRLESLVELTILHCPRLKSLFSLSLAQSLVLLEKLEIIYCPELKQTVTELEGDKGEISHTINSHTSLSFPKLTKLYISTCDGLEYIFPTQHYIFPTSMSPQGLQGLTLNVEACSQLKQVFRVAKDRVGNDSMLQHQQFLRSLSSFSVKRCPLLTDLVVHLEAKKASIKGVRLSAFKESFKTSKQLELREIQDLECLVDTTKNGPTSAFTHLETLFMEDMDGLEALCKGQPPQGFLKNLKHLEVGECCKLQVVGELLHDGEENQEHPLSNLQSLTLYQLPALRWIFKGSPHSFTLQSLKVVAINGCGKLKSLFSPSLIQSLVLLEQLKIQHCNELETLFNDGEIEPKTSSLPLRLPKLRTLFIRACSKLEYVVPIPLAQGLPALASLSVSSCGALKQVFGMPYEQNGVQHHSSLLLPSLQDLELDWLRNLTSFVPQNYIVKAPSLKSVKANVCSKVINFPIQQANNQLELTLKETGLSAFKELLCNTKDLVLHNIGDHKNLVPDLVDLEHLDGLTSISINKWSSGECLVDASQIMMNFKCNGQPPKCFLQNLKILRVVDCEKISEIFRIDDGIESNARYLPNLKFVEIRECPSLEYFFPHTSIGGFSHLEEIKLVGLRTLKSIVGENNFLEAPTLKILYIRGCSAFTNFTFHKEFKKCVFLKELFFSMEDTGSEDVNLCDMVNTQLRQKSPDFEYVTLGNFEQLFQLQGGNIISSLEKMELFNVIRLQDIWKGPIHVATNLRELRVRHCNNLTDIFPVMFIPHLPQLSILNIASCENLKQIIGNDDILASSSSSQGPQLEMKMVFPQLKKIELENLSKLESFNPVGYHLEIPCLHSLDIKKCSKMITSFSADYLTLTVHAKTDQASQLNDISPSREDIIWERRRPTLLPQYKEAKEISPFQ